MTRALVLLLLASLFSLHAEASTPFRDAFIAYSKMRRLEREQALLSYAGIKEEKLPAAAQKLAADLTQARIHFYDLAHAEDKSFSAWQSARVLQVTKKKKASDLAVDKEGLDFLVAAFPQANLFSLVDWESVNEWFGKKTEEAFFKVVFAARDLPKTPVNPGQEKRRVLWVRTVTLEDSLKQKTAAQKQMLEWQKQLAKAGYALESLDITPFSSADDQATELVQALSQRNEEKIVLFSQNQAGGVIYRALDLYPGLRKKAEIRGWVNLNGKLYGEAPAETRAPASLAVDPVAASAAEAKADSYRVYRENLERSPPLVHGFPIVNLLSLDSAYRPKNNLRESIVPEGSTWLAPAGKPQNALPAALGLLDGTKADSGFRDLVSDSGF